MKKQLFIWFALLAILLTGLLTACGDSSTPAYAPVTSSSKTTAAAATTTNSEAVNSFPTAAPGQPNRPTQPVIDQTPLKAGAVDDNLKFDQYLQYLQSYQGPPALRLDVTERYIINVVDSNARTVANSLVKIYSNQQLILEAKTYSNGQLLFFPRVFPATLQSSQFEVVAEKYGQRISRTFARGVQNQNQNGNTWLLEFKNSLRPELEPSPNLDLLFLLDSTGSMGGEIQKIQQTINDIAYQISSLPGTPKVRYGVVTYRDRGDAYITRKFGFTENLGEFSSFLNSIAANGGEDIPESLNEGLHVAINGMNWNSQEAVRLTFLVADAPPHLDYPNDYQYTTEVMDAVKKGIKVYTIGASGLDKQGEYVFRQLAQVTLAQFLFITHGGDEAKPGSGGPASNTGVVYQEQQLDKIVINIVRRELTNLTQ